jgi:hypothetical protein
MGTVADPQEVASLAHIQIFSDKRINKVGLCLIGSD